MKNAVHAVHAVPAKIRDCGYNYKPGEIMRLVILESPFAAVNDYERSINLWYARLCLRDSLMRGEAPMASHLLYAQLNVLDDGVEWERQRGIDAGLSWLARAACSVVYYDRGISRGMIYGIQAAARQVMPIEPRSLYGAPVPKEFFQIVNDARAKALHP